MDTFNALTPADGWLYAENFDQARLARLSAISDFGKVVRLIDSHIESIEVAACAGRDESLRKCTQPVFTLTVASIAFDAFFNGPAGYRACYVRDPHLGLAANLALIDALAERLRAKALQSHRPEFAAIDVKASILSASCKVWLHEDDFDFESPTRDLAVERWVRAAQAGNPEQRKKATWGLCAPTGARIQVKGALLDSSGNEVVPIKKIGRRFEIHEFGYS